MRTNRGSPTEPILVLLGRWAADTHHVFVWDHTEGQACSRYLEHLVARYWQDITGAWIVRRGNRVRRCQTGFAAVAIGCGSRCRNCYGSRCRRNGQAEVGRANLGILRDNRRHALGDDDRKQEANESSSATSTHYSTVGDLPCQTRL